MDLSKPRLPVRAECDKTFLMPKKVQETGMNPETRYTPDYWRRLDYFQPPMSVPSFRSFSRSGRSKEHLNFKIIFFINKLKISEGAGGRVLGV